MHGSQDTDTDTVGCARKGPFIAGTSNTGVHGVFPSAPGTCRAVYRAEFSIHAT